jgi:hypothetical protein
LSFELREGQIEIGAVGRQNEEPCPFGPDDLLGRLALMRGEIVEDNDISLAERRSELGLNPNQVVRRDIVVILEAGSLTTLPTLKLRGAVQTFPRHPKQASLYQPPSML